MQSRARGCALTWVHLERALEVERSNVEHPIDCDVGLCAALDWRVGIHRLEACLDTHEVLLRNEVGLVEQDAVGEGYLLNRLVLRALGLDFVQVLLDVLRVDQRDDPVEARERLDVLLDEERLRDGRRVCHPCGLDHDQVEALGARFSREVL